MVGHLYGTRMSNLGAYVFIAFNHCYKRIDIDWFVFLCFEGEQGFYKYSKITLYHLPVILVQIF